jgi:hypothetical protein
MRCTGHVLALAMLCACDGSSPTHIEYSEMEDGGTSAPKKTRQDSQGAFRLEVGEEQVLLSRWQAPLGRDPNAGPNAVVVQFAGVDEEGSTKVNVTLYCVGSGREELVAKYVLLGGPNTGKNGLTFTTDSSAYVSQSGEVEISSYDGTTVSGKLDVIGVDVAGHGGSTRIRGTFSGRFNNAASDVDGGGSLTPSVP